MHMYAGRCGPTKAEIRTDSKAYVTMEDNAVGLLAIWCIDQGGLKRTIMYYFIRLGAFSIIMMAEASQDSLLLLYRFLFQFHVALVASSYYPISHHQN